MKQLITIADLDRWKACGRYEAADEIDRLRSVEGENKELRDQKRSLEARIEALESNAIGLPLESDDAILYGTAKACELFSNNCHIITTGQIDEAWEWTGYKDKAVAAMVRLALAELGIVRCECPQIDPTGEHSLDTYCPDCNGRGWMKK